MEVVGQCKAGSAECQESTEREEKEKAASKNTKQLLEVQKVFEEEKSVTQMAKKKLQNTKREVENPKKELQEVLKALEEEKSKRQEATNELENAKIGEPLTILLFCLPNYVIELLWINLNWSQHFLKYCMILCVISALQTHVFLKYTKSCKRELVAVCVKVYK